MTTQKAVPTKAATTPAPPATSRKPWIKKTPVQVVLDQIGKQQEKVDALRADLTREELSRWAGPVFRQLLVGPAPT